MFKNIFEILFIISSIGILFKICNSQQIFYKPIITIISLLLIICLLMKKEKFEQYGGKEVKISKTRKKLLNRCGLPDNMNTSHCFSDSTHHTCCILGPKARKYADNSGNPIGKASVNAYKAKTGKKAKKKDLTSWCTCTGSEVCSYYADKFKDGTHLRFINDPSSNKIASNLKIFDEKTYKKKYGIGSHNTPGIYR